MRRSCLIAVACLAWRSVAAAAPRQHVLTFGKWMPVKLFTGPDEDKALDIKIRALYVDGHLREFTTGDLHDITERVFVVRRAYRLNDWLPVRPGHCPQVEMAARRVVAGGPRYRPRQPAQPAEFRFLLFPGKLVS